VEDRCQKLHTRVLALQADLEIARAERKELETLVNTLRSQVAVFLPPSLPPSLRLSVSRVALSVCVAILVNTRRTQALEGSRMPSAREALGVRSANTGGMGAGEYGSPGMNSERVKSPAAHLFMAGSLSGTPGKVAKILLGSSERHR
jgi:hypothetical protein